MIRTLSKPVLIGGFTVLAISGAYLPTALDFIADCLRSPWAHSFRGEPTLTGLWRGDLVYSAIGKRSITLEIRHDPKPGKFSQEHYQRRGGFDGVAEITNAQGYSVRYEVWGRANRDGSEVHINFKTLNQQSLAVPQPVFTELQGVWRGQFLELTGKYEMQLITGSSSVWNSDWPSGTLAATLTQ